jgi:acetylglutamate synthase
MAVGLQECLQGGATVWLSIGSVRHNVPRLRHVMTSALRRSLNVMFVYCRRWSTVVAAVLLLGAGSQFEVRCEDAANGRRGSMVTG